MGAGEGWNEGKRRVCRERHAVGKKEKSMRLVVAVVMALVGSTAVAAQTGREELSLNGVWDFYPDGKEARHEIRVPSFWDAPQDYGYPAEWLHMRHGIYRRTFRVPESMRGQEIFLKIARVSVIAQVFVNGQQVGAEDSGGYLMMQLPYRIDITPLVRLDGDNRLEVRVWGGKSMIHGSDSQDNLMKEDDFPPDTKSEGRFLYPYGVDHWDGRRGINGDVTLLALPKMHVADVFVIPELHKNGNAADDELTIRLTLANRDGRSRTVQVRNRATLAGSEAGRAFEPMTVTLPAGTTMKLTQNARWTNAAYWWPHDPKLYRLETALWEKDKALDGQTTRFGFRQFYVNGDHYELNGIRANLRGDAYEFSWHEGFRHGPGTAPVFSTKELIPQMQQVLIREYQKLNNNMLRPHKASAIDELYDACDELGLLVIDEAPFWETWVRTDERAKPNFEAWIKHWVTARRNHPSIVAWIASNECWYGPTAAINLHAVRSVDTSRPSFNEDPWGPQPHIEGAGPFEGDEDCRHYTGGYPINAFNTEALYDVYRTNPNKPTGEGESLFADGFPLLNADGTLSGKRSQRGEFGHPDMISQAQWVRGVCRLLRAMRYAGLADARLYASWMYAFDPVEADLTPEWKDLTAPGLKPLTLHRPIINVFTGGEPVVRYNDGRGYYRNSFSSVAVFDKDADRQNRIGIPPLVFQPKDTLRRTLVIYNDEFSQGTEIDIRWAAAAWDPHSNATEPSGEGACTVQVPYGEKREQAISFQLPAQANEARWLNLTLLAAKAGQERFRETTRLGAIRKPPAPKLVVSPQVIELGHIKDSEASQWHTLRLVNLGGGPSVKWSLAGAGDALHFNLTAGNLRGEQEVYFQVKDKQAAGDYRQDVSFTGEGGTADAVTIHWTR
jgi:hypothetical protein